MPIPLLTDYEVKLDQILQDTDAELDDATRQGYIAEAIKTYSNHRPLEVPLRVTGDGEYSYALPEDWEDGFSKVRSIEYPAGEQEPVFLDMSQYIIYRDDTGLVLRFLQATPSTSEEFIFTYLTRHTVDVDEATIPEADMEAICNLAGALSCLALGRKLAEQVGGGGTFNVQDETWRSIIRYSEKAKELMDLFSNHMGINRQTVPAMCNGILVSSPSWGPGWATH